MNIKEITPFGEYVVLKFEKVENKDDGLYKQDKKTKLFLPNQDDAPQKNVRESNNRYQAKVFKISDEIKDKVHYKVGDIVVFNDYDLKYVGKEENLYGILKYNNVMASYEESEDEE